MREENTHLHLGIPPVQPEVEPTNPGITGRIDMLVNKPEFEDRISKLFQRETHSKSGEHVFLVLNDHRTSETLLPQYFIQVFLEGHTRATPRSEEYKWYSDQTPEELFAENLARIDELLNLFEPKAEATSV